VTNPISTAATGFHLQSAKEKGTRERMPFLETNPVQKLKRKPSSPQVDRGMITELGAMKPAG
jgi:hypothetical protein